MHSGRGGVNGALKTLLHQVGQVAAMIQVCVAEEHGPKRLGVEGKLPVAAVRLATTPLVQAAFQEQGARRTFQ